MSEPIEVVEITDGLAFILYGDVRQIWSEGKARKRTNCCMCAGVIQPGKRVYRPLGNGMNRMKRAQGECFDDKE